MKKTNEKMIKGYKGFSPGMICRGKQYAENTLFHEKEVKICAAGMHFCEHPLKVLFFYPPVNNCQTNEYAIVEAPCGYAYTDDGTKYCTKELHIKNKLSLKELGDEAILFIMERIDRTNQSRGVYVSNRAWPIMEINNYDHSITNDSEEVSVNTGNCSWSNSKTSNSVAVNTGDYSGAKSTGFFSVAVTTGHYSTAINFSTHSIATTTGLCSIATNAGIYSVAVSTGLKSATYNSGCRSIAINTGENSIANNTGTMATAINIGDHSAAVVDQKGSCAIALGRQSIVKGGLGSWIVCAEWKLRNDVMYIANLKAAFVDGEKIKADTYYMLKNGKFVEVKDA